MGLRVPVSVENFVQTLGIQNDSFFTKFVDKKLGMSLTIRLAEAGWMKSDLRNWDPISLPVLEFILLPQKVEFLIQQRIKVED